MNFKSLVLLIGLLLVGINSYSQTKKHTISGYVKNSLTGEALIGAKVFVNELKSGTITNVYGFYSLTLPEGEYEILYDFVGFQTQKKGVTLTENLVVNIDLVDGSSLDEVIVTGEVKKHESTEIGTIDLSMDKVKSLPVLLGEVDIIKTAQLMPGIQSGSEGSSGIYVRGGGPDQNLILLDGVPIYNANHLFGFFSVFNADAVNSVKIIKGGFPASYGGRMSSVIDIRMNEGDMKKLHGEGSVGIISSKLMLNGPIISDKTSFMISARRTYIDLLVKPFIAMANEKNSVNGEKTTGGYFFYDVNTKLNHIINDKNRIYFSAYLGDDKFYLDQTYPVKNNDVLQHYNQFGAGMQWGNKIMALRWNHQYGPKLFSNTTLSFSQYKFSTSFSEKNYNEGQEKNPFESFSFNYLSGILDWGGRIDFYYYPTPKHKINFGGGEIYHTFTPGVNQFKQSSSGGSIDTLFGSIKTFAHEFYTFIEDDFKVSSKLSINAGLHFANLVVRNTYYPSLQPRFSLNYQLDEKSSFKASYVRMAQFLHLLTNTSLGLPTDLWVPATDLIPPQNGGQFSLGYVRELPKGFQISTEGYYKDMNNLIEYKEGASFFSPNSSWEELVEIGKGWSYGLEVLFEKKTGKTTGWIGYTLSWTNRQFENLNNGQPFPYRYDRRHDISFVMTHKFSEKIDVGVVWVYGTGNAISMAFQKYNWYNGGMGVGYSEVINQYEGKNNYRMPSYHRLDVGVNLHKDKKWGKATWSFGVYNTYNRQNPFFLDFGYMYDDNGNSKYVLKQYSLFPLIPSVSYSFKF